VSAARGTVVKRGTRWSVVLDLGMADDGRRLRQWHSGYASKREAERARTELLSQLDRGSYVAPDKLTLAAFLLDEWLPAIRSTLRPTTLELYRVNITTYIAPAVVGRMALQKVTPAALNAFYADLLEDGRSDGHGGLGSKSVRNIHGVLHKALADAVRWGRAQRNVADLAAPPRWNRPDMVVWTAEQLRTFLRTVADDRIYAAWLLLATTGMRRGEVLGLRWSDLDLDQGSAGVVQSRVVAAYGEVLTSEPKTAKGRRAVALDAATTAALRAHRAAQAQERLALGPAWRDSGLVFTLADGGPIHPQRFTAWFGQAAARAGLPRIRLHDLRHSYATLALGAGIHPKIVSERLGHATVAITLDVYSHVSPSMQREAAGLVASWLLDEPPVAKWLQSSGREGQTSPSEG